MTATPPASHTPDPLRPGTHLTGRAIRQARFIAGRIAGLTVTEAMRRAGYAETTARCSPLRVRFSRDPDILRRIEAGLSDALAEIAPTAPPSFATSPQKAASPSPAQPSPLADTPAQPAPSAPHVPPGFYDGWPYRDPAADRNAILRPGVKSTRVDLSATRHVPAPFPMRAEDYTPARPRVGDTRGRITRRAYSVRRVGVRPRVIDD
jgi:hypothetical protein